MCNSCRRLASSDDGIADGGEQVRDFVEDLMAELLIVYFEVKRLKFGDCISDLKD